MTSERAREPCLTSFFSAQGERSKFGAGRARQGDIFQISSNPGWALFDCRPTSPQTYPFDSTSAFLNNAF